jgi:hypothetical protein
VADPTPPNPKINLPGQLQIPGLNIPQPAVLSGDVTEQTLKNYIYAQDQIRAGWGQIAEFMEGHANDLQAIAGITQNIAGTGDKMAKQAKERAVIGKAELRNRDDVRKVEIARLEAEEKLDKLRKQNNQRKWEKAIDRADMIRTSPGGEKTVILSGVGGQTTQRVPMTQVQEVLRKQAAGEPLSTTETDLMRKLQANVGRDLTNRAAGIGLDDFTHGGVVGKLRSSAGILGGLATGHVDVAGLSALVGAVGPAGILLGGAYEGWKKVIGPALAQRRELTQLGQVSGQGTGAGLSAKWEAMTMGANPFDMITGATAMAIVKGVREAGFSGQIAKQIDQGVKGTIEDLGISVDSSIKMISTAMRQGNESIKQITDEMKNFDSAANAAGESVQQFTDSVQATSDALRNQIGSGKAATTEATGLESFFSQKAGFPAGTSQQVATQLYQNRFLYAGAAGVNPLVAGGSQLLRGLETFSAPYIQQAMAYPDVKGDPNKAAEYLSVVNPNLFPGWSIPAIAAFIRQTHKFGRHGASAAINLQHSVTGYSASYASLARRTATSIVDSGGLNEIAIQRLSLGHGNTITASRDEQIRRVADYLQHHPTGRASGGIFGNVDQSGARIISGISQDSLTNIRRNALRRAFPYLSDAGRKDLEAHLSDFHDNFEKRLQEDVQKHRRRIRQQGDSVNALPGDTVVVTIDPKTKKTILSNNGDSNYDAQAAYGAVQANQRPPWSKR